MKADGKHKDGKCVLFHYILCMFYNLFQASDYYCFFSLQKQSRNFFIFVLKISNLIICMWLKMIMVIKQI